jgi:hypothetical protein
MAACMLTWGAAGAPEAFSQTPVQSAPRPTSNTPTPTPSAPITSTPQASVPGSVSATPQSAPLPAPPPAGGARILLLPRLLVAGERATLAVLDVNGRLTPNVEVTFSNGDRLKTDTTGRALFAAPLTPGVITAALPGRGGRVNSVVLAPAAIDTPGISVTTVPRVASISDRFDVLGQGFCGDADANSVTIGGQKALVLAASPLALVVLPPAEAEPGASRVEISCAKQSASSFQMTFVELVLEADGSPLAHGEHRTLRVVVHGSAAKLSLEARNLAPDVAELVGGVLAKQATSGEAPNAAKFEVIGKKKGSFLISIRLAMPPGKPLEAPK